MNKASKNSKVLITLVLLALAFFCSFHVTHSYFTATTNESGNINFADLDVRFVSDNMPNGSYTQDNLYTLNLYPVGGTIARGQEFKLTATENGAAISSLRIKNMANSSTAYVRFWIDAYIVTETISNEDGTTGAPALFANIPIMAIKEEAKIFKPAVVFPDTQTNKLI